MDEQQQKNIQMINKLKCQINLYKSRNQGLKSKLDWFEDSIKDLTKLYPRIHSKIKSDKDVDIVNCLDNTVLLKEMDKLRKSLKCKELNYPNQTDNTALSERLRLTGIFQEVTRMN